MDTDSDPRLKTAREKISGAPLAILALAIAAVVAMALTRPCLDDEAYYVEPGANLFLGRGFTSGFGWRGDLDAFWGGSTPGMSMVYGGWYKLFGFGFAQTKTLGVFVHLVGVFGVVLWARRRFGLNANTAIGLAALLVALPAMVRNAAACRPDAFGLPLMACYLFIFFPPADRERPLPLWAGALGFATSVIALHHAFYFALMVAGVFFHRPARTRFLNAILVALGMAIGMLAIFMVYSASGAWDDFLAARQWHYDPANRPYMPWVASGLGIYAVTPDVLALGIASAWYSFRSLALPKVDWKSRVSPLIALGIFLLVPLLMSLSGIFYREYGWTVVLPVLLLLTPNILQSYASLRPGTRLLMAAVSIAALIGATSWRIGVNAQLDAKVQSTMARLHELGYAGEPAVVATAMYHPMKLRCDALYISRYPFWPQSGEWSLDARSNVRYLIGVDPKRIGPGLGGRYILVNPSSADKSAFPIWRRDP